MLPFAENVGAAEGAAFSEEEEDDDTGACEEEDDDDEEEEGVFLAGRGENRSGYDRWPLTPN